MELLKRFPFDHHKTIGLIDSGLGGLTILNVLKELHPAHYVYLADTKYLPYGQKTPDELTQIAFKAVQSLLDKKATAIIFACHTLSAVTQQAMQEHFQGIPFLGMIDLVAPAAVKATKNGRIGIMGTQATINAGMHKTSILTQNPSLRVFDQACPLLETAIESIPFDHKLIDKLLDQYVSPFVKQDIDTLILGCTHYPLVKKEIKSKLTHRNVNFISADNIIKTVFKETAKPSTESSRITFLVSGNQDEFVSKLKNLITHHLIKPIDYEKINP